jgi:cytochrome c oxidase subunit 2
LVAGIFSTSAESITQKRATARDLPGGDLVEITLKKGEPVILRLTSTDRVHGFMSRPFKIDTDIPPDKTTDVTVTPAMAGDFTIICDHYCGTGHGNMKLKVTVVQ